MCVRSLWLLLQALPVHSSREVYGRPSSLEPGRKGSQPALMTPLYNKSGVIAWSWCHYSGILPFPFFSLFSFHSSSPSFPPLLLSSPLPSLFSLSSPLQQLEESLKEFGHPWQLNPGDGAFYGPKVTSSSFTPSHFTPSHPSHSPRLTLCCWMLWNGLTSAPPSNWTFSYLRGSISITWRKCYISSWNIHSTYEQCGRGYTRK